MAPTDDPRSERVLLGIDPGLRVTGYGIVSLCATRLTHLDHGAIRTGAGDRPSRLVTIFEQVQRLLATWRIDEVAVEKQFVSINASSAFALGEARAASVLAAALTGLPVFEYTPADVKHSVTSYGRSSKEQIQEMVRLQFGLDIAPSPTDASDALAVAICHAAHRHLPMVRVR